jgi:hypothetical protein
MGAKATHTKNEGDTFLQHESWAHYLQPETKTTSRVATSSHKNTKDFVHNLRSLK